MGFASCRNAASVSVKRNWYRIGWIHSVWLRIVKQPVWSDGIMECCSFYESCNGCCPWLWQLFSNEMIECSELSNSLCLAIIHTADMPLSNAQCCTVHHNTLQWPQLPAFLKTAQGHLQFRIQVETSFALFMQHEAKFGLRSTQNILLLSRIFPEALHIIVSELRGIWK